jgi:hypothetical protein
MEKFRIILRWSTKIVSVLILGLVFFIIGAHAVEAFQSDFNNLPNGLSGQEIFGVFALGGLILGTLIGLKWELIGGLMAVVAFIAIIIQQGRFEIEFVFGTFLIIGILNIVLHFLNRRRNDLCE